MEFFGILPRLLNKHLLCTIYYRAASIKVVYILKIPPLHLILPRCGLNTIFSTYKYKVISTYGVFGYFALFIK